MVLKPKFYKEKILIFKYFIFKKELTNANWKLQKYKKIW